MRRQQVEARTQADPRAVLPIGRTEQHTYLSLCTDSILAERAEAEAAARAAARPGQAAASAW